MFPLCQQYYKILKNIVDNEETLYYTCININETGGINDLTNVNLLKEKIDESGYKIGYLAKRLNLSHQGFYNKINGKTGFYSQEIMKLEELLRLSKKEREDIFFSKKVD